MDTEPPNSGLILSLYPLALLALVGLNLLPGVLFLMLLLLSSALISGSEVAFFSLDQNDINDLEEQKTKASKRILKLLSRPSILLSTILVANNLINIGIILLSGFIIEEVFPDTLFEQWTANIPAWMLVTPSQLSWAIQFFITVVLVTFILVLFGEVTPKVYANWNKMSFSKMMSWPLFILNKIFYPISSMLAGWTNKINRVSSQQQDPISKEELDKAIELTLSEGTSDQDEVDMLKAVIHFTEVPVKQIMCNRQDIFALDWDQEWKEIIVQIKEKGLSRIPVYKESLDNIVGILYVKDLVDLLQQEEEMFDWHDLIRDRILYSPENRMLHDLLKEFQAKKIHMAIVVDEYGGTSGLITMEDILEEVIGDIKDEFDELVNPDYIKLDEHNYIFEADLLINDMCRILDVDPNTFDDIRGESNSVAGLLLEITGQIPRLNQVVTIGPFSFKVLSVNKKRIQQIKLTIKSTNPQQLS